MIIKVKHFALYQFIQSVEGFYCVYIWIYPVSPTPACESIHISSMDWIIPLFFSINLINKDWTPGLYPLISLRLQWRFASCLQSHFLTFQSFGQFCRFFTLCHTKLKDVEMLYVSQFSQQDLRNCEKGRRLLDSN